MTDQQQQAKKMLQDGVFYLETTGLIKKGQVAVQDNAKSKSERLCFYPPNKFLTITTDVAVDELLATKAVFQNASKMGYAIFRSIVTGIGRKFYDLYSHKTTVLDKFAEESKKKAYFKDLWYLINYVDRALRVDKFSVDDMYIKPFPIVTILKTIALLEARLDFSDTEKAIITKICDLSSFSLAILYNAVSAPIVETKIMARTVLDYFALADPTVQHDFELKGLKHVPAGQVRSLILTSYQH